MKQIMALTIGAACLTLTACGGEKRTEPAQDSVETAPIPTGPSPVEDELTRHYADTIRNRAYDITVRRYPDNSLPTVKDELGQDFLDNSVEVTITRDGTQFFSKTFRKEAFEDYLSKSESATSVLLGMAYDEEMSTDKIVCLAAQVGHPGVGEGPAFTVEIPISDGPYSIVRDTRQDTNAEEIVAE